MNEAPSQTIASAESASRPHPSLRLWLWRWFWRVNLVAWIPIVWYCFYVPANSITWADSYASAQQRAAESGKPIILFFTGKWCVPCRIMKRNVWADQQVATLVNPAFIPVIIDVDDSDNDTVRNGFRIGATPVTIITDPQGNILQRRDGGMGKADFLEWLKKRNSTGD